MNDLLNKLFGLNTNNGSVGFGSPSAELSFVHPTPSWVILSVLCFLAILAWWSYRSSSESLTLRASMGITRLATMFILFVLALGPMIEQSTIHTEEDWAMILLDRSGSMSTQDAPRRSTDSSVVEMATQSLVSREQQLIDMLNDADKSWDDLATSKRVVWMGAGIQTNEIGIGNPPRADQLDEPVQSGTNLGSSIQSALDVSATRPVSSLVLVSDGRSFDTVSPELINKLESALIPVFVVPMGNTQAIRDIGIARVEYPGAVFADDMMPMRVLLNSTGIDDQHLIASPYQIELRDHSTGEVLTATPILAEHLGSASDGASSWVTLSHTPDIIGESEFDIVITSSSPNAQSNSPVDLNTTNNQATANVRVVDRPMRVLYIDGYPRWEHRYLKNLLLRERSIQSSSILLASSRRFIQEGDELVAAIPTTLDEWEPYDVIILGDVRSELFTDQQLETLLEHVSSRGAGVLWIAGPGATPSSWIDSPLAPLLPLRRDAGGSQSTYTLWDSPVVMRSTPEADRLGVLGLNDQRTGWLDRLSDPSTGWSKIQWAQMLDTSSLKPGVTVLAHAQSIGDGFDAGAFNQGAPIITSLRSGGGRSIYIGTDEIWRWRYGRGEDLPERFWLPLIRSLGRGTIDRRAAPAALSISPTTPLPDKPAQITLRLFEQSLIDSTPEQVRIELTSALIHDEPVEVTLRGSGDTRVGTWIPERPGSYTASPMGSDLTLSSIESQVRVLDLSDEQRLLDTDHAFLEQLALQTGGQVIAPEDFNTIPSLMPNRTRTVSSPPIQASLWDRPIILITLVLMLAIEWIGRRVLRLA